MNSTLDERAARPEGGAWRNRFDWWQALVRVLSSIEAVRDWPVMCLLLGTFCGGGLALASAQASVARGEVAWAIGQGALGLFVAFYGTNAAGLLSMDRALGRPARDVWAAIDDALGVGHRVLLVLVSVLLLAAVVAAAVLGLFWLSGLPKLGPWVFTLAVPLTVIVLGLCALAGVAVLAPLTGPIVWAGASFPQALRGVLRLMRTRVLQAAVLSAGVSAATGIVGAAVTMMVVAGGRLMAEASVFMLGIDVPTEALMAGLLGRTVMVAKGAQVSVDTLSYVQAATVGGGVVFAVALVLPTLVYLRGVCEVYLSLVQHDQRAPWEGR